MMSRPDSLLEKIVELLDAERPTVEFSAIQSSLEKINSRLDKLEAAGPQTMDSALRIPHLNHPSLDKLAVAEAIADQLFGGAGKEKACTFEPNGRPCDHCSMCNSRGF